MEILVELKQQYGQRVMVPVCEKARLFADLAGTKTITMPTLDIIKKLGYTIKVKRTEPETL